MLSSCCCCFLFAVPYNTRGAEKIGEKCLVFLESLSKWPEKWPKLTFSALESLIFERISDFELLGHFSIKGGFPDRDGAFLTSSFSYFRHKMVQRCSFKSSYVRFL